MLALGRSENRRRPTNDRHRGKIKAPCESWSGVSKSSVCWHYGLVIALVITVAVVVWIAISVVVAVLVGRAIRLRDARDSRAGSPDGGDVRSKAS